MKKPSNPPKMGWKRLTISLPPVLYNRLRVASAHANKTMSSFMCELLEKELAKKK
jgi:hypothetical protein